MTSETPAPPREPEARRKFKGIPLRALIPNAVTALALCAGLTGVRFAIAGQWEKAVLAIVIAGVLDGLDGRLARLLKGTSRFGAELDSLSDVIAFGVSPAIIVYLWSLQELPGVGWVIALSLAVSCALRLARFNASLDMEDLPHKRLGFLTGVPSPTAAGLALSPIFLDLWLETEIFRTPIVAALIVGAVGFLMVSTIPTYSWRSLRLRREYRLPALLGIGLFAGALLSAPFGTLSLLSLAYVSSIPFSIRAYRRAQLREIRQRPRTEPAVLTDPPKTDALKPDQPGADPQSE